MDWHNSVECLQALATIAVILVESWPTQPHVSMDLSLPKIANSTKELIEGEWCAILWTMPRLLTTSLTGWTLR